MSPTWVGERQGVCVRGREAQGERVLSNYSCTCKREVETRRAKEKERKRERHGET